MLYFFEAALVAGTGRLMELVTKDPLKNITILVLNVESYFPANQGKKVKLV